MHIKDVITKHNIKLDSIDYKSDANYSCANGIYVIPMSIVMNMDIPEVYEFDYDVYGNKINIKSKFNGMDDDKLTIYLI